MKRLLINSLAIISSVLVMLPNVRAESAMDMVYFNDFAPYSWSDNGTMRGILIDILEEVLEQRLAITTHHQGYPWARAQSMVEEGIADAFVTAATEQRRSYTHIGEETVVSLEVKLFTYRNNPNIPQLLQVKTLDDLKGFQIVDYIGNGWAQKALKKLNVTWVPTLDQSFTLLHAGRVDAIVSNAHIANFHIDRLGYKPHIIEIPVSLSHVDFKLCIGKQSPFAALLEEFDRTLQQIKKDGSYAAILDKYR